MSRTRAALIVLSFGSGATDAFAFLSLGGVFTANMTGNLVLVGLLPRAHYLDTLLCSATALATFAVALYAGFRTRLPAPALLAITAAIQLAVLVGWQLAGGHAGLGLQCLFIALATASLALQTVVGRGLSAHSGLSTTFVTGTLTGLVQDIADRRPGTRALRAGAIAALVVGAFAGGACILASHRLGPVLPVLAILSALLLILGDAEENWR